MKRENKFYFVYNEDIHEKEYFTTLAGKGMCWCFILQENTLVPSAR